MPNPELGPPIVKKKQEKETETLDLTSCIPVSREKENDTLYNQFESEDYAVEFQGRLTVHGDGPLTPQTKRQCRPTPVKSQEEEEGHHKCVRDKQERDAINLDLENDVFPEVTGGYDFRTRKRYCTRSTTRGGDHPVAIQMPLVSKGQNMHPTYVPFAMTDINCLVERMPPPSEGGNKWMTSFCSLTTGMQLALGDWRSLICRQLAQWDVDQIEVAAATKDLPNRIALGPYATALGRAMRDKFPVPLGAVHSLTFKLTDSENIHGYLTRRKEEWLGAVGCHPGTDRLQTTLFRQSVMAGLPQGVRGAMENNPDLPGSTTDVWERHLSHHIKIYREKEASKKDGVVSAQEQLLKLQLDEARRKVNDKMKEEQVNKDRQMVQHLSQQPPPQEQSQAVWLYNPYWGGPRGGRIGGRGRGRGTGMAASGYGKDLCHRCGQRGHWRNSCPWSQQFRTQRNFDFPPYGVYPDPPHCPPAGRGNIPQTQGPPQHQAPNQGAAP